MEFKTLIIIGGLIAFLVLAAVWSVWTDRRLENGSKVLPYSEGFEVISNTDLKSVPETKEDDHGR
jgi:hypothetical protein